MILKQNKNPEINLLDAVRIKDKPWKNVSEKKIRNCFEKSCLFINESIQTEEQTNYYFERQWSVVCDYFHINESFQTFANFDNNLAITGQLSEADIIEKVLPMSVHQTKKMKTNVLQIKK